MQSEQIPNESPYPAGAAGLVEQPPASDAPKPAPPTRVLPRPDDAPGALHASDAPPRRVAPPPPFGAPPRVGPPPYRPGGWYAPPAQPPKRRGVPWYVWVIGAILAFLLVISLLIGLAVGWFVGVVRVVTGPQVTSTSISTFAVSGTPRIVVNNITGNVTVVTGPANEVTVEVTRKARDATQTDAQRALERIKVNLTRDGNTINAVAAGDWQTRGAQQLSADLRITVPTITNLDLTQTTGNITIDGVTGALAATLTTGNLTTTRITLNAASHISVITGQANVDASLTNGANLDVTVTTGTARLTLPASTSAHLDARVNVGDININGWPISVTRQNVGATASGDLNAQPASTLTVNVTTGSIQLTAR